MAADGGSFGRAAFIPAAKQLRLDVDDEIIVDGFAGAGGMSEAIYQAFNRHPWAALNHSADALSCHAKNHPCTHHYLGDIREACPFEVTQGRPVGLLHLSPDCTHHSQARGGQPRDAKIRALAWVAIRWLGQVRPRVLTLENVTFMRRWGPLIAKRDKATGRVIKLVRVPKAGKKGKFKTIEVVAAPGEHVRVQDQFLIPDPKRIGKTFRRFLQLMKDHGYETSVGEMNAANFGAGTSRNRLFIVARRDGAPIVWPSHSHAKKPKKGQRAMLQAAEFLDFNAPARSIFDRQKPLAPKTMRRLATGVERYVKNCADPFIVPFTHGERAGERARVYSIRDVLPTITGANRGELGIAQPVFADAREMTAAFMAQHNNNPDGSVNAGHSLREPISAMTGKCSHQQLVTVHLVHFRGNCDARSVRDPLMTLSAGGEHHGVVECRLGEVPNGNAEGEAGSLGAEQWNGAMKVAAFLMKYHGSGGQWADVREPMPTITAADVLSLVTVTINGESKAIVDVRQRMISPREALACQGIPASYVIECGHDGRRFSRSQQFKMIGNSVSPPPAIALLRANLPEWVQRRKLAKAA